MLAFYTICIPPSSRLLNKYLIRCRNMLQFFFESSCNPRCYATGDAADAQIKIVSKILCFIKVSNCSLLHCCAAATQSENKNTAAETEIVCTYMIHICKNYKNDKS